MSPLPSSLSPNHPTSTTPGCQQDPSSSGTPPTSSSLYSPAACPNTSSGGNSSSSTPGPASVNAVVVAGDEECQQQQQQGGAAAMMGHVMGAALAVPFHQQSGVQQQVTGEIDLNNLEAFQDPPLAECNVDELISHELRMDGSLDFAFNGQQQQVTSSSTPTGVR